MSTLERPWAMKATKIRAWGGDHDGAFYLGLREFYRGQVVHVPILSSMEDSFVNWLRHFDAETSLAVDHGLGIAEYVVEELRYIGAGKNIIRCPVAFGPRAEHMRGQEIPFWFFLFLRPLENEA